jgi:aryl-alcohol dehydrogenase-like predicted oxidoreductase
LRSKLEDESLTQEDIAIIKRVEDLANKRGWSMAQVALAWSLNRIVSPIIGFSKIERIDEALDVRGKELSKDEITYLEELYKPKTYLAQEPYRVN